jgi:hypothetical protein
MEQGEKVISVVFVFCSSTKMPWRVRGSLTVVRAGLMAMILASVVSFNIWALICSNSCDVHHFVALGQCEPSAVPNHKTEIQCIYGPVTGSQGIERQTDDGFVPIKRDLIGPISVRTDLNSVAPNAWICIGRLPLSTSSSNSVDF